MFHAKISTIVKNLFIWWFVVQSFPTSKSIQPKEASSITHSAVKPATQPISVIKTYYTRIFSYCMMASNNNNNPKNTHARSKILTLRRDYEYFYCFFFNFECNEKIIDIQIPIWNKISRIKLKRIKNRSQVLLYNCVSKKRASLIRCQTRRFWC